MPLITLPDGSQRIFECSVSVMDIALNISPHLAKICIAGCVNNKLVDTVDLITEDACVKIITETDEIGLEIIRHSCGHLLGRAVKQLWPNAQMMINNALDNGFYYDIDLKYKFTFEDLLKIENRMHELVKNGYDIVKKKVTWQEAYNLFTSRREKYKIHLLDEKIKRDNFVTLHCQKEYIDICSRPHIPNIKFCRYFKLQTVSDIFNDSNNKTLQRIYGVIWTSKKQLDDYLQHVEEVANRDHRKISRQLDLYHMQEEAPGMVFWHHNGWIIFRELESFVRSKLQEYEYQEVRTPCMMDRHLWETTGHWENYHDAMFITSSDNREYCIKPMNCPAHVQIFSQGLKSYRDLPLRIAEFGTCHRNEPSGSLHGLMRLRSFTQDDAHIFCMSYQICEEVKSCISMAYDIYSTFGFKKITVKLSTRPIKRIGSEEIWDNAEADLAKALQDNGIAFEYQKEEGAFYGPKIEFILYDCLNRSWQCGTIQLDFSITKCLNATYINQKNERQTPVMIHRALLGSIERFIGIVIEEFAGLLPTWLAPVQVVVMNITCHQIEYVNELTKKLQNLNIRVKTDLRNEKIGLKIREHTLRHVPYMLICGQKELKVGKITVRTYRGKNIHNMDIELFIKKLQKEIRGRHFYQWEE
ncbi:threonine--tRNA ligase [Candidatus Pantoea carbekii]|uniref:threonine--tRNA ligase n=1 Tax=Candidatus Pantoea carbekii TaxID=1235990 RepID=UPI0006187400|nr:threonine--tRNA ligase [Candidatus Pantoea carbekii]AKC32110.1 Threonyl-tRNA synthetase ThrS [Candidatus Pantoea carbekii]